MKSETAKILIVDDLELMRAVLKNALSEIGISDVQEAQEGKIAKDLLIKAFQEKKPYDVVFCDWNMPVMTGLQLLEELRADDRFKELPFVMVTAESEKHFVIQALKEGATDYIVKPISGVVLRRKVESIQQRFLSKK